jgi:hypothetical protein
LYLAKKHQGARAPAGRIGNCSYLQGSASRISPTLCGTENAGFIDSLIHRRRVAGAATVIYCVFDAAREPHSALPNER